MQSFSKTFTMVLCIITVALVSAACQPENTTPPPKKVTQSQKAKQAANSIQFTENAEIENIKRRLELTSQAGLLGFVAVINAAGAPVMYTCVKGKITSGGKRLTPQTKQWRIDRGAHFGSTLGPAPSDEGSWGSSNPYVYWWTCSNQYIQTSGNYVYSDKPFRLTKQPLIAVDKATLDAETNQSTSVTKTQTKNVVAK